MLSVAVTQTENVIYPMINNTLQSFSHLQRSKLSGGVYKKILLKCFHEFIRKHLCWNLFLMKLHAPLLKRDSTTSVFLWILRCFLEQHFMEHLQPTTSAIRTTYIEHPTFSPLTSQFYRCYWLDTYNCQSCF